MPSSYRHRRGGALVTHTRDVPGDDTTTSGVRFEVSDSGIGMSEGCRRNLFQKFSQADASITRRYGGTGSDWRSASNSSS